MTDTDTNLFGEPQNEPSLAGDDLQWEADDTFQSVQDAPLPSDEDEANTNPDEGEGGSEGADDAEENGDDPADADTENTTELPEQFRGKTAAELVAIIQSSQSFIDRQGNEIGDLRRAVEQIQALQEEQGHQPELVPASDYIHTEQDGLFAYREAIAMLDRGEVGPNAIDDIIDVVRDIAPVTAAKMDRDFGMRLARAEMQQQMAPVIEQSYNDALRQATTEVNADPDAEAYREDLVRIVQSPATLLEHQVAVAYQQARTATDIKGALTAALQIARGANPVKSTAFKQTLVASKKNGQSEHGNATQVAPPKSEEEQILDGLLNPKDAGADLFSGFGAR
jgi:hypothetical protein